MKFAQIIPKEKVLSAAMQLIRRSKKEIVVTMDVDEEVKRPLPMSYHKTLAKKVQEGITITRYGYGTKKNFDRIAKKYTSVTYSFGESISRYQRMLIVDRREGIFRLGDQVYYTQFIPLVRALLLYPKEHNV